MPPRFRSDLEPFLREFAEQHRGVRLGLMFGRPAVYAGRRLVTCLMEDGLIVRLPVEVARQELRGRGTPFSPRPGGPLGSWVMYRPRTLIEARRLSLVLEKAADHVARRQTGEESRVKLRKHTG